MTSLDKVGKVLSPGDMVKWLVSENRMWNGGCHSVWTSGIILLIHEEHSKHILTISCINGNFHELYSCDVIGTLSRDELWEECM